jgi:23S rRNA (uracil1939-C5)-methyltransferase
VADFLITRMGEKGDGLARGRAFPRSLPGETVDESGRVQKTSPDRIATFCSVFETCGGCKLQHWAPAPYQAWKRELLVSALAARGLNTDVNPLIDAHGQGRRRVALHVRQVGNAWRAGFMVEGSHALVPIEQCPILAPQLQTVPQVAAAFGRIFGDCDVLAVLADNGIDIAIKATRKLADKAAAQFDSFMRQHAIARIAVNGQTIGQLVPPIISMGKARVALPVAGFLQATARGEEVLATLIHQALPKSKNVADLFCGLGPFALRLAETRSCTAIDSSKPAIVALNFALRNTPGLKPMQAEARDLFQNPLTPAELNEYDAVVLDPPRAGAEAQCKTLAKSKVKRVAYVSCDRQTLARDAAILAEGGYVLERATPVDQFKFSPHLETVAVFIRGRG